MKPVFLKLAALCFALALCAVQAYRLFGPNSESFAYGVPGSADFIEYYGAYQLLRDGHSPYDNERLLAAQQALGGNSMEHPILMYNPPWCLLLLAPILELPFHVAALAWLVSNVALLGFCIVMLSRLYPVPGKLQSALWFSAALFYPAVSCVIFGQLGILLGLAIAGFSIAAQRGNYVTAGFCLFILSIKPLLFILPGLTILFWSIQNRRFAPLLIASLFLIGSAIASEMLVGGILYDWLRMGLEQSPVDRFYKNPTLAGFIRAQLTDGTSIPPRWPLTVLPFIAAFGTLAWLFIRRPIVEWPKHMPILICISLLFAPYAWVHDQTTMLIAHVALLADCLTNKPFRFRLGAVLLFGQLAAYLGSYHWLAEPQDFWWFPAFTAVILAIRMMRREQFAFAPKNDSEMLAI